MRYTSIGGLKSSKTVLGTDYYGQTVDKSEVFQLIDLYREHGGNHIDTAKIYSSGESERLIGEWLRSRGRDGIIVATKGGHPEFDTMDIPRLSTAELEYDLDGSLARLGVDCIDLYWLHRDGNGVDCGEVIEALNSFVKKGKIRFFGASNWSAERINAANEYAAKHGLYGFCASQIKFSPAITSPSFSDDPTLVEMNEKEFEYYKTSKLPVLAFAPQAKGFFSKMAAGGEAALSAKARDRYLCAENLKRLERIKTLAEDYGYPVAAIVCALLSSVRSTEVLPIIGGKNESQLSESLRGADIVLDDAAVKEIIGF